MILRGRPAAVIRSSALVTCEDEEFGPLRPPRRITCVSALPVVVTTAPAPCTVTLKNVWLAAEARQASTATWTSPSVPFLNPTGIDRPEASWPGTWLSVARPPGPGVGDVVGGEGVEPLAADRQSRRHDVEQQPARGPQAAVDVVCAVHARVVDQALPPGHRARLLEVHPHHDH